MSIRKQLRLTCYYCDARVAVDFYAMRKHETAHDELHRHGWIFGIDKDGKGGVYFDALCTKCGRGVVEQMISSGAPIEPDAKQSLQRLFPDLFKKEPTS